MNIRRRTWVFFAFLAAIVMGAVFAVNFPRSRDEPHSMTIEFAGATNRARRYVPDALFLVSNRTAENLTFVYSMEVLKDSGWTNAGPTRGLVSSRTISGKQMLMLPVEYPSDGATWRLHVSYTRALTTFDSLRLKGAATLLQKGWSRAGRFLMPRRTLRHFVTPPVHIDDIFFPERKRRQGNAWA